MNKKTHAFVLVPIALVAAYFIFSTKKTWRTSPRSSIYTFKSLPAGTAALVQSKDAKLTGKAEIAILFEDILDEHYKSLVGKQQELMFLAGFEQILKSRLKTFKAAAFKLPKPGRPLEQVCSQYGVACERLDSITFDPQQKEFLIVDGESFSISKIQQNTVPLLGVKSEILNYLLFRIDETLRSRVLYFVAKSAGLGIQEFTDKHIISNKALETAAEQEVTRLHPQVSKESRKALIESAKGVHLNRSIDSYLHSHVIRTPIVVNIDKPSNDFKTRWEWTPFFGEKPGSSTDVVLFVDIFSDASHSAIRQFLVHRQNTSGATFGVRPYFQASDQLQWLAAEITMCVWKHQPEFFWKYLENSLSAKRDTVEGDLNKAVEIAGANLDTIKKCTLSREMKEVAEYHLQSAQYLKIINTPVYFIGNEVVVGPLSPSDFEKTLSRQD